MGLLVFIIFFFVTEKGELLWRSEERQRPHAEVFYNVVQAFCYSVMALLIMRLKLFMTPHLCICSAILANNEIFKGIRIRLDKRIHSILVVAVIAAMAYEGTSNIEKQLKIKGEYSNPEQEMLFDWIMKETKPNDVERTKKVYSVFSKKPLNEVHETLRQMGANYVVFQLFNCAPEPNRSYYYI
ncbi:hypothetical protein OESDEN_15250 [Oesophagostomum dentatum]|uniref:Uncharacterized protein n=1 Tax=Oesophagostomum dentatum TaxID=61180 RepID=A0A0B1SJD7_OESDE|nr:hypothetical protein OESDEN_15250 [Oesophagostomum dentatum]